MLFLIVIIGVSIGLFAGLLGGKAEHFLNSLMNGILAFPDTILRLLL